MRTMKLIIVTLMMAVVLTGCGVKVTEINISDMTLNKGESETLAIEYLPEKETTEEKLAKAVEKLGMTYSSSDIDVASVDEAGVVTAKSAGTAEIEAVSKDGTISGAMSVTVKVPATGIKAVDVIDLIVHVADEAGVEAVVLPADATDVKLVYSSSDEAVATVDGNGVVRPVGNGECEVTSTIEGTQFSVSTKVTVNTAPEALVLNDAKLTVGNGATLKPKTVGENITVGVESFTYTSDNPDICTVDEAGKIKGVSAGTAVIHVKNDLGQEASCNIVVELVKCGYCGKTGHTSSYCPTKKANEAAAAAAAQAQAAAQAAAQAQAQSGGSSGGSSGGGSSGGGSSSLPHTDLGGVIMDDSGRWDFSGPDVG